MTTPALLLNRAGIASPSASHRTWHLWLAGMALTSLFVTVPAFLAEHGEQGDLRVYSAAGRAMLHDVGLYSPAFFGLLEQVHLPFIYPPIAAVLFTPLAVLPFSVAQALFTAVSVAALATICAVVAGRLYGRSTLALLVAAVVTAGSLALQPVRSTIEWGQVNLVLTALVAADCLLQRTRWPRGTLLGLAAAVKLTPAVFGLYFLVRKQYKAAAVAAGTFVTVGIAGFLLAPQQSVTFWLDKLFDERVGVIFYMNQGVFGVLRRLELGSTVEGTLWVAVLSGLLVAAVVAARRAVRAGELVTGLLVIAVWGLLASPISWAHHWVWVVVPAVALPRLVRVAGRTRVRRWAWWLVSGAAAAVFVLGPHPWLGFEPFWLQQLLVAPYTLLGAVFLIAMALPQRGHAGPQPRQQLGVGLVSAGHVRAAP